MKKIKMIGLDLDGTLLNDKKELTSHTREILTRAIDQGVTVLVATGRPVTGIPEVLRNFPGMRYALTSNGGRILDLQEDKVLDANMLSYEMGAAIADKLGMDLKIEDMAFDSIIPAVQSGKADIGAAGMTVTEDRATQVDFSDSYYTGVQVIIVTDDSDITEPDDLKGKKIGVQQGTTGDIYSTDDFGDDNVERFNKGMEAVQALQQGKIDAVIIDNQPAKTFVEENEGLKILETSYVEEDYALAIKKGNDDLVKKVNDAIKELKEDGTFDKIVAKYITD